MIVGIISETAIEHVLPVTQGLDSSVEVIEWRLDYLPELNLDAIQAVLDKITLPVIFTLRAALNEKTRLKYLLQLVALSPAYIDIESHVDDDFVSQLKQKNPLVNIIRSLHYFYETPTQLDSILEAMQHPDVSIYKLITYAKNSLDNLRVLHCLKKQSSKISLVMHCMGDCGLPSRILGPIFGNVFTYGALNAKSPAPACPSVADLMEIYRVHRLNTDTKVYALLGDPVAHSIGHLYHNKIFSEKEFNCVYVKFQLKAEELPMFFKNIKGLPFSGFSVTMPLKEAVIPFVDELNESEQEIGAVNTIKIISEKRYGINTDGDGALDAIEQHGSVKNKRMLIIGAGGAAKAIAYAAHQRGAAITVLNRTLVHATSLAESLGGVAYDFQGFKQYEGKPFNVVISAVPSDTALDVTLFNLIGAYVSKKTIFMGIDYLSQQSLLSEHMHAHGCVTIGPREMFYRQAARQQGCWSS
ncbi:MAG: shikimate biosynthesis protein AroDE [marine bacterium B5-7]|nr:MAG: shikimate biosynthesis protein AroDE [marine bacterium B5-7]